MFVSEEHTPRETITTYKTESPLGRSERRAYISSLSRLGQHSHGRWQFRTPIDEGVGEVTTTINKSGEAKARDIVNAYESSMLETGPFHEQATQMASEYPKVHADAVKDDLIYSVRAATKSADKPKPERSSRLGAESVSNKELVDYIVGTAEEPGGIGIREAYEFLNALSPNKRKGVLKALTDSGNQKALDVVRHYNEDGSVRKVSDKLNKGREGVSKAVENMKKQGTAKRNAKKMAENLRKLRESRNPMKTLSEISSDEQVKTYANENPSQFREALNEAIANAVTIDAPGIKRRFIREIRKQMQRDGLLFKHGGILKYDAGGSTK
jgi:hypothetical protein